MKRIISVISIFLVVIFLSGCKDNPSSPDSGNGSVKIYMVDSPADYDAVNIVVSKVEVNQSADASENSSGWVVINDKEQTYNLLDLRNGANAVLGENSLKAGHYSQVRLILGTGSNVVMNGIRYDLTVPSGTQTGIKLVHGFDVQANSQFLLTLDFNVNQSILVTGSGKFMLKPTIKVVNNSNVGTISGTVSPVDASVMAIANQDTVSTVPDSTGYFKLNPVLEGNYNVHINSYNVVYNDTTINNVEVKAGSNTDLGTITLSKR